MVKNRIVRSLLVPGIILGITVFSGIELKTGFVFADDDSEIIDQVNVMVTESCTVEGIIASGGDHIGTLQNNQYVSEIGTTTFRAYCNDNSGYAIYAIGFSNEELGNTLMKHNLDNTYDFNTGVATSGNNSNWAMKLTSISGTYQPTIHSDTNGAFTSYHVVPNTYTKVVSFASSTDLPASGINASGSGFTSTYAVWVSPTQVAGTYTGKVKYTLVHPMTEVPARPLDCTAGKICYYPNSNLTVGTMAQQSADDNTATRLYPSNYSRDGYGFAGWSTTYDYSDPTVFYGPQETITTPADLSTSGLSLYAHWVKSEGIIQNWVCPNNTDMPIGTVTALTDLRDNDTYAVAKLADGKCWMIENLRLDNAAEHNSDGSLAQGYGGLFRGLAGPEQPWYNTSNTTANSLYYSGTQTGTASIDLGTTNVNPRFPRYNNQNTASRSTNTTNTENIYSYGNYYTWPAAVANTELFSIANSSATSTSICPAGWRLPTGGIAYSSSNTGNVNVTGRPETYSDFYNLGYAVTDSNLTAYEDSPNNGYSYYSNSAIIGNTFKYPNNIVFSGVIVGDSIDNRNSYVGYWSSASSNTSNGNVFYSNGSTLSPGTIRSGKACGWAVRCVTSSK